MKNNSKNITKNNISKEIYSKFGTSEKTISLFIDNIFDIFKEILKKEKIKYKKYWHIKSFK